MEIKNLHIEGSKVTYQEFPGTYQYAAILHCLPIQIGWYTGTLVRYQTYQVQQAYVVPGAAPLE